MTQSPAPANQRQSTWAYVRYRANRDIGGAIAWFRARWSESRLFRLAASAFGLFLALWIALFVWLASDLPEAEFCQWLTREVGVAAIPLSAFYADSFDQRVVRFCFAKQDETLLREEELAKTENVDLPDQIGDFDLD